MRSLEFGPDNDERKALRLDAEWRIGEHTLRFGYDDETFTSRIAGAEYSGGVFYRRYTPVDFEDSWNGSIFRPTPMLCANVPVLRRQAAMK